MCSKIMRLFSLLLSIFVVSSTELCAQTVPANPVTTCADVRTYIAPDNSMTMDAFKQLLTAAGNDLSKGGNDALDMQCKVVPYVKNAVIMIQHIMKTSDGTPVAIKTQVVLDGGACKLSKIELSGC